MLPLYLTHHRRLLKPFLVSVINVYENALDHKLAIPTMEYILA